MHCWFHMWDYDPPPYAQIFVCIFIVLIPYIDDARVLFMGIYGGRREGIYVPYEMDILHVIYATCFRENIRKTMLISCTLLSP